MTPEQQPSIQVWYCDKCGYWRKEKSTEVHQTDNPDDWRGKMVTHGLRLVVFVPEDSA